MALSETDIARLNHRATSDQLEGRIHGLCEICNDHIEELTDLVNTITDGEGEVTLTDTQRTMCKVSLKLLLACAMFHEHLSDPQL